MEFTNQFIFFIGLLLSLSIVATIPAERSGAPLLLVFLGLGMLAGEDGIGQISFDNAGVAHLLGTAALAVILFDGGLHTPFGNFRKGWGAGLSLATVGVAITALVTAATIRFVFATPWVDALLLASIVSSTDAAAVFYLLRAQNLSLHPRVRATLEVESGINDPTAIFLTITLIHLKTNPAIMGAPDLLSLLLLQLFGGIGAGTIGGYGLTYLVNRLRLAPSLYPLLALSGGLLVYGTTASLGASGFLAAYLAGLIVGNRVRNQPRNIRRFHDGIAWLAQIGLFLMLGLLVTPSQLISHVREAVVVAVALLFLARPVAVALCLAPLRFTMKQLLFLSWVGLRGGVPIVLSLFPLLAGVPQAYGDFNVVFFVVLLSLVFQGWTVGPFARLLGLDIPASEPSVQRFELEQPRGREVLVFRLPPGCQAIGRTIKELKPPAAIELMSVIRRGAPVRAPFATEFAADDLLFFLVLISGTSKQERINRWLEWIGAEHSAPLAIHAPEDERIAKKTSRG